jgi:O-antigen/teichoic acid export membrane protein
VHSHQPTQRQTVRNLLSIWANRLLAIAAPLVTTPLIANEFGLAMTGLWLLASQLASQLALLDAGISNSLIRLLARERGQGTAESRARFVSTAFAALAVVGLSLLVVSPWIVGPVVGAFDLASGQRGPAVEVMWLAIVFVGLSLPLRTGHGMLASAHRFDVIQLYEGIGIAARLIGIVLLVRLTEAKVSGLAWIVFGSTLATLAAIFVHGLRQQGGSTTLRPSMVAGSALREIVAMGLAAMVVTGAAVGLNQFSASLVGMWMDTSAVAHLALPLMIFASITPFFSTFAAVASPIAAGIRSGEDKSRYLSMYLSVTRYLASAAFLLALMCWWLGPQALSAWLAGPRVSAQDVTLMAEVLLVLLAGLALTMPSSVGRSLIGSVGGHWAVARAEGVTAVAGLGLGAALVGWTSLGVTGMAIGVAAALALRGLAWYPAMVASWFDTPVIGLLRSCMLRPTAVALSTLVASEALRAAMLRMSADSISVALAVPAASVALWVFATWWLVLTPGHRAAVLQRARRR